MAKKEMGPSDVGTAIPIFASAWGSIRRPTGGEGLGAHRVVIRRPAWVVRGQLG